MILAGQLLLAQTNGVCEVQQGHLRVEDAQIVEVELGSLPRHYDVGGEDILISPGFIDAHLHLPQFDMMGAHGMPLMQWLSEVTFPEEMKWEDVDHAKSMTMRVVDQLLSNGTTGICAFATIHHDSTRAAIEILRDAGIRGVAGQSLMDREAPEPLLRSRNQLLDEADALANAFPATDRMSAAVTPRFAVSCTRELLAGAGHLAQAHKSMIQSHLAETNNECRMVADLFDGQSYVDVYAEAGLMTDRSVYGHGIHLSQQQRETLSNTQATIAHCPTANTFLRSGTMNRSLLVADGVKVALGSDIGAGYERSMIRVARAMIESAAALGNEFPGAAAAWYAITAGNAESLGWPLAGQIAEGATADLLVIQPTIPWRESHVARESHLGRESHVGHGPHVDPLSKLMFAWDDRWLQQTIVRGRTAWRASTAT